MATINDVCLAAGVSKATVSRVLNGSGQVKPATREAVLAAIKRLDYQPNALAQALATNTSRAIGLILPAFHSSYFGSVLHHAEQGVQQAGKKLLVVNSKDTAEGEREAVETLVTQRCDAILLYSRHLLDEELESLQQQVPVPLVMMNRQLQDSPLFSLGFDQTQAASLAMQHLLDLGHRQIACITSPLTSDTGRARYQVYRQLLEQYQLPHHSGWVVPGDNSLASGYQAATQLVQSHEPFTAIFACNDDMAIGAMRALYDNGVRVPQHISVIGIDNEPAAGYAIPSLSTVSLPITRLTRDAVALAIELANKRQLRPVHRLYGGKLIARESTRVC